MKSDFRNKGNFVNFFLIKSDIGLEEVFMKRQFFSLVNVH